MNRMDKRSKRLVRVCPVCDGELEISRLKCCGCETQIDSRLPIPAVFNLPDDMQEFVLVFLRCRGNIREVEKVLKISYPTVCKRLEKVNEMLGQNGAEAKNGGARAKMTKAMVLDRLERGEITAGEAAKLLISVG